MSLVEKIKDQLNEEEKKTIENIDFSNTPESILDKLVKEKIVSFKSISDAD